jgi:hypothetical protein
MTRLPSKAPTVARVQTAQFRAKVADRQAALVQALWPALAMEPLA